MKKFISIILCSILLCSFGLSAFAAEQPNLEQTAPFFVGERTIFEIREDGSLWGWGNNEQGQLGTSEEKSFANSPHKIMDNVSSVSSGYNHTLILTNDGQLYVCGANNYSQLGIAEVLPESTTNGQEYYFTPIKVMDHIKAISTGDFFSMAIKEDGSLWGWGANDCSQVCRYSYAEINQFGIRTIQIPFKLMDNVKMISCGANFSMAIKEDGSLWGWGSNASGELGIDSTKQEPSFIHIEFKQEPIKVMDDVKFVNCSDYNAIAIKEDNSLWGWGSNELGQLGIGTIVNESAIRVKPSVIGSPRHIADNVVLANCSARNIYFLNTSGVLFGMGGNYDGALGFGEKSGSYISPYCCPEATQIMDQVSYFSAHSYAILALKMDGSVWGWGLANNNQFLDGGIGSEKILLDRYQTFPKQIKTNIRIPAMGLVSAVPNEAPIMIDDGTKQSTIKVGMYTVYDANGGATNYVMLRDIAYALNNTQACFEVEWKGDTRSIALTSNQPYTAVGGELAVKGTSRKVGVPTESSIYLDGELINMQGYTIDQNNYFKLRDVGRERGFNVSWDSTKNMIVINTNQSYSDKS